jgi:putative ABC transport system permease protein
MLRHYLKIAFRNQWKYKTQSFIGIFGLAFGLACFVPALYWIRYETSYDNFYTDAAYIYRIYSVEKQSGKVNEEVPGILARKLNEYFPACEAATGFIFDQFDFTTVETPFISLRTMFADSVFFRIFPQAIVCGDTRQSLHIANTIVLTETVAVRLFGDVEKAIGQQIKSAFLTEGFPSFTVTSVIKDLPPNTNLQFDAILFSEILMNMTVMNLSETEQWKHFNQEMYVKFHPRTDINTLATELRDFTLLLDVNANIELRILPISDVRHRMNTDLPFTLNFIRLFVIAGVLLLFSALFNFLNLHLDLFRQRIRELRQRTVHGAKGWQLMAQMMFELFCTVFLSLVLACCFVVFTSPAFSKLLDIEIPMSQLIYLFVVCGILVMVLMLLVGFIPFWRLSRLVLRDLTKRQPVGQPMLRSISVTLQLAVSVVFIVASLVVMMQMRYVNRKNLGFEQNGIVQLQGPQIPMYYHGRVLMNEIAAIPQIENISTTLFNPQHIVVTIERNGMTTYVEWTGKSLNEKPAFHWITADSRFAETFKLNMLMGKWWGEGDRQKVVLNEEAARVMGLIEPIGAIIRMSHNGISPTQECEVVGVVRNFHTLSLRSPIYPTIFRQDTQGNFWYMRVVPGQENEVIRRITAILPGIDASLVDTRLTTLDELYDHLNRSEQVGLKMFTVMATVCLFISLFGIYGIANASTQRRRKEIAIRKVVGADRSDIVRMFFCEYTLQVIIAGAVALPVAYLAMNRWLQGYAYRTNIPWWLLAGVIVVIIAVVLLTVLGQVLKAANRNPAKVVKSE